MPSTFRKSRIFVFFVPALLVFSCGTTAVSYNNVSFARVQTRGAKTLIIRLSRVETSYSDNTKLAPDTMYSDSFLIAVANSLLRYEAGKQLQVTQVSSDSLLQDSAGAKIPSYSVLAGDTLDPGAIAERVKAAAAAAKADLVLLPYACRIKYSIVKPAGWRNGKYESSAYDRPTRYLATTAFHLQLWTRDGKLLYEKIGTAVTDRLFLYDLFKREKPNKKNDIVGFAKWLYAPPLIKSLYNAIKVVMNLV